MPTLIATLGSNTANSYQDAASAAVILDNQQQTAAITAWLALGSPDKDRSLITATSLLEPLEWKGYKITDTQNLQWPRDYVPIPGALSSPYGYNSYERTDRIPPMVLLAHALLAADITATPGLYTSVQTNPSGDLSQYSSVSIGPISVELKQDNGKVEGFPELPSYVRSLLEPYLLNQRGDGKGIRYGQVYRLPRP
jgi:hypothetical protein